jgi:hypothetical protein
MNQYQSPTPRTAMAFVAVALTAVTIGVWVIAPTKMESGQADARAQALPPASAAIATNVTRLEPIEVVAPRKPTASAVFVHHIQQVPKHKQQT